MIARNGRRQRRQVRAAVRVGPGPECQQGLNEVRVTKLGGVVQGRQPEFITRVGERRLALDQDFTAATSRLLTASWITPA